MVAGRSLGELVRKLGDRVLPTVVPLLQAQLNNVTSSSSTTDSSLVTEGELDDEDAEAMRQGVCLGLVEILAAASKTQVEEGVGMMD